MELVCYDHLKKTEVFVTLPNGKKAREKELDRRRIFICAACSRGVSWDFGADVGHPDAAQFSSMASAGQPELPFRDPRSKLVMEADAFLRQCCDGCWGEHMKRIGR